MLKLHLPPTPPSPLSDRARPPLSRTPARLQITPHSCRRRPLTLTATRDATNTLPSLRRLRTPTPCGFTQIERRCPAFAPTSIPASRSTSPHRLRSPPHRWPRVSPPLHRRRHPSPRQLRSPPRRRPRVSPPRHPTSITMSFCLHPCPRPPRCRQPIDEGIICLMI